MLSDEILEKIFSHRDLQQLPICMQDKVLKAYTEVLEQVKEENPYGSIHELFSTNE